MLTGRGWSDHQDQDFDITFIPQSLKEELSGRSSGTQSPLTASPARSVASQRVLVPEARSAAVSAAQREKDAAAVLSARAKGVPLLPGRDAAPRELLSWAGEVSVLVDQGSSSREDHLWPATLDNVERQIRAAEVLLEDHKVCLQS